MAGYSSSGKTAMIALGLLVGLLLSLYVFDEVIDVVAPQLCNAPNTSTTIELYNASATATGVCVWDVLNSSGAKVESAQLALGNRFATAILFIDNILAVVGILGAFEIIWLALRRMRLV